MAAPRKNVKDAQEEAKLQEEANREDAKRDEEAAKQEDQAKTEENQNKAQAPEDKQPEQDADQVDADAHEDEEEDRDEKVELETPIAIGQLVGQRAVVDTSGTAGPADMDIRRGSAAFDQLSVIRDDVPEHLRKYLESDEGFDKIVQREADRREDMPSTKPSKQ